MNDLASAGQDSTRLHQAVDLLLVDEGPAKRAPLDLSAYPRTAARVLGVLLALAGLGVAYPLIVDTDMDWWLAMHPGALLLLALLPDDRPVE